MSLYRSMWAPEDDARLRELVALGKPFSIAAELLSRTRNACIGRAHRLGLVCELRQKVTRPQLRRRVEPLPEHAEVIEPEEIEALFEQPEVELLPDVQIDGLDILSIGFRQCRWPVADAPVIGGVIFCGCGTSAASSYCDAHARKSVVNSRGRR